jgi:hypothetical protein
LRPTGMPCNAPRHRPLLMSRSAAFASASALSAVTVMNAFKSGFSRSIRARHALVSSVEEIFRPRTRSLASSNVSRVRSSPDRFVTCASASCEANDAARAAPAVFRNVRRLAHISTEDAPALSAYRQRPAESPSPRHRLP